MLKSKAFFRCMFLVSFQLFATIQSRLNDLNSIEKPYFFNELASKSISISKEQPPAKYVSLYPNKNSNGGFGNVIYHFLTVQGVALATQKHAIFNNAVLNELFDHPNLAHNESWKRLSRDEISHNTKSNGCYSDFVPCGKVAEHGLITFCDSLYIHGCFGNNLMHPEIRLVLADMLKIKFANVPHGSSERYWGNFPDMVFGHLTQWTFSNPTPYFKERAIERIRNITDICNERIQSKSSSSSSSSIKNKISDGIIDLVIQIRTFRDNSGDKEGQFMNVTRTPIRACALLAAREAMLRQYQNHQQSLQSTTTAATTQNNDKNQLMDANICVYVTSDFPTVSNDVKSYLESHAQFKGAVVSNGDLQLHEDWLSISLMGSNSVSKEVAHRPDLLDWMVMSNALSSLYTAASTYGASARLRSGYFETRHDYIMSDEDGPITCKPLHNQKLLCDACHELDKGNNGQDLCPPDVRNDCKGNFHPPLNN